jgi:hypothetical protein
MSGSSRVEATSEDYHLSSESPCMNFHHRPEDPGQEMRWHREWKKEGKVWLRRVKPVLEQRFAMLVAQPDPDWPIVRYDEAFPLWNPYHPPESPPPWRLGFMGMNGPGITQVTIAFSRMPSEAACERLKQELIKDVAILDSHNGVN